MLLILGGCMVKAHACGVCLGGYTDGEIFAYQATTVLLLLMVVSLMGSFFYWIYKVYIKDEQ